jgi:secreted trypsin-like serine protease
MNFDTFSSGDHDILNNEPEQQNFTVKAILPHPGYSTLYKNFDIALVRLNIPANYTANVLPICMLKKELPAGTNCFTAGWGTRTSMVEDYPQFLRQAVVPIISQPTCKALYREFTEIYSDMMCAGYTTGTVDACQGDSGGPLMCQQGHKWYLAGLTSFGLECAANGYPGIYANVTDLHDWVELELSFY